MFPRLFHIGNFSIPTYGVMAALGLIAGLAVVVRGARRQGVDPEKAWNLGLVAIISGLVGAKILMVINDWQSFGNWRAIFSLTFVQAAGVFYGGLLLAIAACVAYIRWNHMPVLRTCDVFAPGIALGHAFGRLGCFAAGCCYGKPTHLPWAVTFTNPDANGAPLNIPLHPTQIYESLIELLICGVLYQRAKRQHKEGSIIALYLILSAVARLLVEFVRAHDEANPLGGPFTLEQWISLLACATGFSLLTLK